MISMMCTLIVESMGAVLNFRRGGLIWHSRNTSSLEDAENAKRTYTSWCSH
jgi:hypothetical protein